MKVLILAIFIVSCASTINATSTSTESTTTEFTTSATTEITTRYPSDDYCPIAEIKACGTKYGTPAAKKQFPYVAFLKSRNVYQVKYCSGSLIHERWVLTSAYCTLPDSKVEVTLGALVPFDEEDPDRVVVQSEIVFIHPEYLPRFNNPKNDVALVKLSRPVGSGAIIPIVLKRGSGSISKGEMVFAAWGEAGYETLTFTKCMVLYKGPCKCYTSDEKSGYEDAAVDSEFFCCPSVHFFCFIHNGAGLVVDGVLVAIMSTRCFPHCRHDEGIFTNIYKHQKWIDNTLIADTIPDFKVYGSCNDISSTIPGIYLIQPNNNVKPFEVYCELRLNGEKWTVIQQRFNKTTDFFKSYYSYTYGFGPLNGNHWLGLEKIYQLTKNGNHELLVELQAHNLTKAYALYSTFKVGSSGTGFKLTISGYSGNAGDSMYKPKKERQRLNGMKFSTYDKDQDKWSKGNCASKYTGGWWFNDCSLGKLNGLYRTSAVFDDYKTMYWYHNFGKYSIKASRMMIRKK